jgi:replication factor A2
MNTGAEASPPAKKVRLPALYRLRHCSTLQCILCLQGRGGGNYSKTLLPVVISSLSSAVPSPSHDSWQLRVGPESTAKYVELSLIRLVGRIVSVDEVNLTQSTYVLHDGTGEVTLTHYFSEEDTEFAVTRSALRPHNYCEVVASVKYGVAGGGSPAMNLQLWIIRPLKDSNALLSHLMSALYNHLLIEKGPLAPPMGAGAHHSVATGAFGGSVSGYGGRCGPATMLSSAGGDGQSTTEMKPELRAVLAAFKDLGEGNEDGASIAAVQQRVAHLGISEAEISKSVDFLSMEGFIYSTIDDYHFKVTS